MRFWRTILLALACGMAARGELPGSDQRTALIRDPAPRAFSVVTGFDGVEPSGGGDSLPDPRQRRIGALPTRTPLESRIFGRIEEDGYTVERVQQPFPGVYLAGNLYRPRNGTGPFPAVLFHHGHRNQGRLEATELVNVPAGCIQLARLGFVAFSPDMIGYLDSTQFSPRGTDGRPPMLVFRKTTPPRSEIPFSRYGISTSSGSSCGMASAPWISCPNFPKLTRPARLHRRKPAPSRQFCWPPSIIESGVRPRVHGLAQDAGRMLLRKRTGSPDRRRQCRNRRLHRTASPVVDWGDGRLVPDLSRD